LDIATSSIIHLDNANQKNGNGKPPHIYQTSRLVIHVGTNRNEHTKGKLSANVHRQITTPDVDPTGAKWLELLFQVVILVSENAKRLFFINIG